MTDSAPTTATTDVVQPTSCPSCLADTYSVIAPARYPAGLTAEALARAYSASSDSELMDQLVRCSGCDLAYLNPRVRDDVIMRGYEEAEDPTFAAQNPQRIATFQRNLVRVLRSQSITPSKDVRVLDVGCAGGAFPKAADNLGLNVTGVEPCRWLAARAKELYDLDIRTGVLSEQAFENEMFDVVTMWDVIEHLTDPIAAVQDVRRILKPNGLFIVNYPDYGSWVARLMGRRWPFLLSVHLIYFTRATVSRFLRTQGFEVVRIRPYWQTLSLGYVLQRAGQTFRPFGWMGSIVNACGAGKIPVRYQLGQSLVLARKIQA